MSSYDVQAMSYLAGKQLEGGLSFHHYVKYGEISHVMRSTHDAVKRTSSFFSLFSSASARCHRVVFNVDLARQAGDYNDDSTLSDVEPGPYIDE